MAHMVHRLELAPGLVFTLVCEDTKVMEAFVVTKVSRNHREEITTFSALHFPSRERPQHFHRTDAGAWTPTGREGLYSILWGEAINDLEVVALADDPAGESKDSGGRLHPKGGAQRSADAVE